MGKTEELKSNGTYNTRHTQVMAAHFKNGVFFDPEDILQVKYEMLRSVSSGECTVSQASRQYGLSRESFYKNKASYEAGGLQSLIPRKTGPKGAHKLAACGCDFIDSYLRQHPNASVSEINRKMQESTDIHVHNRTIERYLSKKRQGSR